MKQRTPEWKMARLGKMTASKFYDVISKAQGHADLVRDLAWERHTGNPIETFSNAAMQRGIDLEPEARDAYQLLTDQSVTEVAFLTHPNHPNVGVSPDGLVGDDGMIEIKCTGHRAHLEVMQKGKVPARYRWQVQGQLWASGRKWLDFVSYHPDAKRQVVIVRVVPSVQDHQELNDACTLTEAQIVELLSTMELDGP